MIPTSVRRRKQAREQLKWMRERWPMYATTREAFVVFAGRFLEDLGGDVRQLNQRTLSVPGTHGKVVDQDACCLRVDQDFANKVMDVVEDLLKKKGA